MRTHKWTFSQESRIAKSSLNAIVNHDLPGKTISFFVGPIFVFYWFPPLKWRKHTVGAEYHVLFTESLLFFGAFKNHNGNSHLYGISFYSVILKVIIIFLFLFRLIDPSLTSNEFLIGLGLSSFWYGGFLLLSQKDEDSINDSFNCFLERNGFRGFLKNQ
ncbi:MAG: hypothetical protein K5647_03320 [Clostridiales bacterium]|nr:hypothetical protein [Clostridiales bacterium]